MAILRTDYLSMQDENSEYYHCPDCGRTLYQYPWAEDYPAILLCTECDIIWVDTCNMLRWLARMNKGQLTRIPGGDPNGRPDDSGNDFCLLIGGKNPDSGVDLNVEKFLKFLADMMEE